MDTYMLCIQPFEHFLSHLFIASIKTSRTSISILDEVLYHASSSERQFFDSLDYELDKISRFYNEKEQEAKLKLDVLKVQVQFIAEFGRQLLDLGPTQLLSRQVEDGRSHGFKYQDQSYTLFPNGEQRISYTVARNRLKKAITEYYRSLEFLKSYRELNETGFQKILKKFDKIAGWKASTLYMKVVRKQHWITSTELNRIINETEVLRKTRHVFTCMHLCVAILKNKSRLYTLTNLRMDTGDVE
ncbi:hypothetical protein BCV71DRAFT_109698 [Rhizopus microsporus]|uniref:SPX domain-containing protein n=1 Tax=Rhizopus microsporus TaxID=58291 RepID=A0A1X0S3L3_RHIZD|nr:hypothetical protein BCV71DRAFT_109698 [Rhizopus microsporus]